MSYYYDNRYDDYYEYNPDFEDDDCFEPDFEDDYVDRFAHRYTPPHVVHREYDDDPDFGYWYNIPFHPNHQVGLRGEIRHKYKKNILKPIIDKDGYYRLSLGNVDNVPVHRVACMAFYGVPDDPRMQVNHIDCNRRNNCFWNLEWVTPSRNIKWGVMRGNIDPMKGIRRAAEVNPKPVRIVETGPVFRSVKECAEYLGTLPTSVSRVLRGERKGQRIHGYHIEYVRKEDM